MREHINLFESQEQEIHEFMKKHGILKYDITPEGIDVYQEVILMQKPLIEIPFQFNIVHGYFNCSTNKLQTLKNAPREVRGGFSCKYNNLTSLEFCPKFVQGVFYCHNNWIPPWEYRYLLFSEIQGKIHTRNTELNVFFEQYQNKKSLIPEALKALKGLQNRN